MTPDTYPSLFWAYTALWGALSIYIVTLGMRLSRLEKRLPKDEKNSHE
jgi:CcmD family protein